MRQHMVHKTARSTVDWFVWLRGLGWPNCAAACRAPCAERIDRVELPCTSGEFFLLGTTSAPGVTRRSAYGEGCHSYPMCWSAQQRSTVRVAVKESPAARSWCPSTPVCPHFPCLQWENLRSIWPWPRCRLRCRPPWCTAPGWGSSTLCTCCALPRCAATSTGRQPPPPGALLFP